MHLRNLHDHSDCLTSVVRMDTIYFLMKLMLFIVIQWITIKFYYTNGLAGKVVTVDKINFCNGSAVRRDYV